MGFFWKYRLYKWVFYSAWDGGSMTMTFAPVGLLHQNAYFVWAAFEGAERGVLRDTPTSIRL
jgi:hypothetical protein